jgi:hypothetical protein
MIVHVRNYDNSSGRQTSSEFSLCKAYVFKVIVDTFGEKGLSDYLELTERKRVQWLFKHLLGKEVSD